MLEQDEGDASVPTHPLIHPRPYGRAKNHKTHRGGGSHAVFQRPQRHNAALGSFGRGNWTRFNADGSRIIARNIARKRDAGGSIDDVQQANTSNAGNALPICMQEPTLVDMSSLWLR